MRKNREGLRDIGARFKRMKEELRLSTARLAARLGISSSTCSKYEYGETFPGPNIFSVLAEDFDVSLDWLLAAKGPMFYSQKASPQERAGFEEVMSEVKELLADMERLPLLRCEILGLYHRFKIDHRELLESSTGESSTDK